MAPPLQAILRQSRNNKRERNGLFFHRENSAPWANVKTRVFFRKLGCRFSGCFFGACFWACSILLLSCPVLPSCWPPVRSCALLPALLLGPEYLAVPEKEGLKLKLAVETMPMHYWQSRGQPAPELNPTNK